MATVCGVYPTGRGIPLKGARRGEGGRTDRRQPVRMGRREKKGKISIRKLTVVRDFELMRAMTGIQKLKNPGGIGTKKKTRERIFGEKSL